MLKARSTQMSVGVCAECVWVGVWGGEKRHEVDACECAFGPHMCTSKQNMGTSSVLSTCELLKQRTESADLPSERL